MGITQNGVLKRDDNDQPVMGGTSSSDNATIINAAFDPVTRRLLTDSASGSGTVTDVSVVSANGFAGSVATSTTTPAITLSTTITGILSGNGTAISAASTTGTGAVVLANSPTFIDDITLGSASGATGSILLKGLTSGTVTVKTKDAAGTWTFTVPDTDGNSGEVLSTDGNGITSWVSAGGVPTTITVANEATDTSCFVGFFTAATGDLGPKTNANLPFNSNTGVLTLTAPILGTPTSATLTNATGLPVASGISGLGTGVATALAVNVGSAGAFVTFNGALGTPSSGTVTNLTGTASININGTVGATTPAAGTFTTAIANSFVPNASTVPSNGMYLPAANTLGWAINSAAEMQLTGTALSPAADGGSSLGTTALGWQNLFSNTGFVWNIENGDWVATHTAGILTVGTGDLRVTTAGTNSASVVTVGGTQTLTAKTLTAPIIGGAASLADGATVSEIVPTVDGTATGPVTSAFVSGYTSSAIGDLVILDSSSKWQKTDANTSSIYNGLLGVALAVAATDAALKVALPGSIVYATGFPTFTVGGTCYMSETAGAITQTAPTTTDAATRIVGYAVHADKIFFFPSNDWITHT